MNINITARKTSVKDGFREKVEKKLSKFDRFFDNAADALVVITTERDRETVEVCITYKGMQYRAEKTTDDRLDSLDAVVDLLFKQIVKHKSKLTSKVKTAAFDDISYQGDAHVDAEEVDEFDIIKRKSFRVHPMDVQEAILRMNLVGHEFFMFLNSETGDINVVYKRQNGGYGLIEGKE